MKQFMCILISGYASIGLDDCSTKFTTRHSKEVKCSVLERNDLGRKLESPAYINRKVIRAAFANFWKNQLYPGE